MRRLLPLLTLFTASVPLLADAPVPQWQRLCSTTADHPITISTLDGQTFRGKCESTDATTLHLNQGPGQTKAIERSKIKLITMVVSKQTHHFLALHKTVRSHLQWEAKELSTPLAPLVLAAMPATIAGGAVATPFALVFDLFDVVNENSVQVWAL